MIGHNSDGRLQSLIQRIERLEDEKAALATDIKEVYAEAKGVGYDPKIMRILVRERKMDPEKRRAQEEELILYRAAVGKLADTPLGKAAAP